MELLRISIEGRHSARTESFNSIEEAVSFYNQFGQLYGAVALILYNGVTVGSIDINRLSAEVTRAAAMSGKGE